MPPRNLSRLWHGNLRRARQRHGAGIKIDEVAGNERPGKNEITPPPVAAANTGPVPCFGAVVRHEIKPAGLRSLEVNLLVIGSIDPLIVRRTVEGRLDFDENLRA